MTSPALVIFDIDGTLLQSHLITVPAIQETFADFGLALPPVDDIQATFGLPVEEYEAWMASHASPEQAHELVEVTNRRELELIGEAGQLYPGVLDTLAALRDAGHALATCSNGSVPYVDEALDAHGLRPFFQVCRCIGQGYDGKTAMVRDIMEHLAARPAVVVGDREGDIRGAHANGALAIAAAYGFGPPEELEDADASVRGAEEIVDAVARLVDTR